jgi:hypothetical protein
MHVAPSLSGLWIRIHNGVLASQYEKNSIVPVRFSFQSSILDLQRDSVESQSLLCSGKGRAQRVETERSYASIDEANKVCISETGKDLENIKCRGKGFRPQPYSISMFEG